jgi:hypothetical protein
MHWGFAEVRSGPTQRSRSKTLYSRPPSAGWRRAKVRDCAISIEPILSKLPDNFPQAAAEAVTVKELAAMMSTGGYRPQLPPCGMASIGGHEEGSIPHWKRSAELRWAPAGAALKFLEGAAKQFRVSDSRDH